MNVEGSGPPGRFGPRSRSAVLHRACARPAPCLRERAQRTISPMLGFLRRKEQKSTDAEGTACHWCRTLIPAKGDEALFLVGAVLDPLIGWFCSKKCARQYGLRFRLHPAAQRN